MTDRRTDTPTASAMSPTIVRWAPEGVRARSGLTRVGTTLTTRGLRRAAPAGALAAGLGAATVVVVGSMSVTSQAPWGPLRGPGRPGPGRCPERRPPPRKRTGRGRFPPYATR